MNVVGPSFPHNDTEYFNQDDPLSFFRAPVDDCAVSSVLFPPLPRVTDRELPQIFLIPPCHAAS